MKNKKVPHLRVQCSPYILKRYFNHLFHVHVSYLKWVYITLSTIIRLHGSDQVYFFGARRNIRRKLLIFCTHLMQEKWILLFFPASPSTEETYADSTDTKLYDLEIWTCHTLNYKWYKLYLDWNLVEFFNKLQLTWCCDSGYIYGNTFKLILDVFNYLPAGKAPMQHLSK